MVLPVAQTYQARDGAHLPRRGDIDYIGQLDDDLEDFIVLVQKRHPDAKIILGGHSAGGATVLRQTVRPAVDRIRAYLLVSPALSSSTSPIERKGASGNETKVDIPKIALLEADLRACRRR